MSPKELISDKLFLSASNLPFFSNETGKRGLAIAFIRSLWYSACGAVAVVLEDVTSSIVGNIVYCVVVARV